MTRSRALLVILAASLSAGCPRDPGGAADAGPDPRDGGALVDAGPSDAGTVSDAGPADAGLTDGGAPTDGGPADAGTPSDAGVPDAGTPVDAGRAIRERAVPTGGGGEARSPSYRLRLHLGAPQPAGEAAGAGRQVTVGADPRP